MVSQILFYVSINGVTYFLMAIVFPCKNVPQLSELFCHCYTVGSCTSFYLYKQHSDVHDGVHLSVYIYIYTHTHTHTQQDHVQVFTFINSTLMYMMVYTCLCIYIHTHTHTHTIGSCTSFYLYKQHSDVHDCVHLSIYIYIYMYIYVYIYIGLCI